MTYRQGLHNFSKGVLSKELWGRVDIAPYSAGVRRGENVIIMKYGGLTNRPGTEFIAEAFDGDNPVRVLPFQFDDGKSGQNYALEMGQGYMRLAAGGGMVVEELLTILGATNTNPVRINIPNHGYVVGDQFVAARVGGMVELNGRVFNVVAVPDAAHFDIDADGTDWGVFTVDGDGGIVRPDPPPPPPPAPVVPPVVQPDPPPPVYGGGGGGGIRNCVTVDTLILMADGSEKPAGYLKPGDMLRTRHETTLEWGDYPVEAISFAHEPVFAATFEADDNRWTLRGTAMHRVWLDPMGWQRMVELGQPAGTSMVARITVSDAHTYVSNGILSHNIKQEYLSEL